MSLAEREDMNIEEAIKILHPDTTYRALFGIDGKEAIKLVEEACILACKCMEKQIPKNWIAEYMGDGDFAWKCPSCNDVFILIDGTPQDNNYNYCPNCGQAMAESRTEFYHIADISKMVD